MSLQIGRSHRPTLGGALSNRKPDCEGGFAEVDFLLGFYIVVSRVLKGYSDTDVEKAASLVLLEEPDSRQF